MWRFSVFLQPLVYTHVNFQSSGPSCIYSADADLVELFDFSPLCVFKCVLKLPARLQEQTMHIAQRYDSDQVVFTRHRARADAALNSPLIAPGFSLLSYVCAVTTTKNDKHGLQTGSGV